MGHYCSRVSLTPAILIRCFIDSCLAYRKDWQHKGYQKPSSFYWLYLWYVDETEVSRTFPDKESYCNDFKWDITKAEIAGQAKTIS